MASCPSGTAVTRMTAAYPTLHCRVWPTWWLESRHTHSSQRAGMLYLHTSFDYSWFHFSLPLSQFCAQPVQSRGAFCRHLSEGGTEGSLRVIEGNRRRMVVDVRLENKGENAYSARLNITYTPNLRFSSLIVKVPQTWAFRDLCVSYQYNKIQTITVFDSGQLWHQNRVLHWGQTEEWEDLQCQCSVHEGQNSGEISFALFII